MSLTIRITKPVHSSCFTILWLLLLILATSFLSGCFNETVQPSKDSQQPVKFIPKINPIGYNYYTELCSSCHGEQGQGNSNTETLVGCETCNQGISALKEHIVNFMPVNEPSSCLEDCANYTAEYILVMFNDANANELEKQEKLEQLEELKEEPPKNSNPVTPETNDTVNTAYDVFTETTIYTGARLYAEKCQSCHGVLDNSDNSIPFLQNCVSCQLSLKTLSERIENTMPLNNTSVCDQNCAKKIAEYIISINDNGEVNEILTGINNTTVSQNNTTDTQFPPIPVKRIEPVASLITDIKDRTNPLPENNLTESMITSIGQTYYIEQCMSCHLMDGSGINSVPSLINCTSCNQGLTTLAQRITDTMPLGNVTSCNQECAQYLAGYILSEFEHKSPTAPSTTLSTTTPTTPSLTEVIQPTAPSTPPIEMTAIQGEISYMEKCASCHGVNGTGGNGGTSLISCAACNAGPEQLIKRITKTMPLNNVTTCDSLCAQSITEYILANFNGQAVSTGDQVFSKVILRGPSQTLRKTTLNLVGRLPSTTEILLVQQQSEQGLLQVLDQLMQEEAFYQRLIDIYNDELLQNKYFLYESAIDSLADEDYPNRQWYRNLGLCITNCVTPKEKSENTRFHRLRDAANDAIAQEVYQLIKYTIKNNLPFSHILTADYIMANYYSAKVYGVESQHQFRKLDINDPNYPDDTRLLNDGAFTYDPRDFRPVQLDNIPHSGVLTSHIYLNRFPTTRTNRNRHRAKMVFSQFLDTDILAIGGGRPDITKTLASHNPTLDNPMCTVCHSVMDPVAAIFQNWNDEGRYRPARLFDSWYTDMLPRGFNGQTMPLAGNEDNSLQWLGAQISQDPRFARATIKTLFKGLTGQTPLKQPGTNLSNNSPELQLYLAQRELMNKAEQAFLADNQNIRTAIKTLIIGSWFRIDGLSANENQAGLNNIGAERLLTPEMLDKKITNTLGLPWERYGEKRLNSTVESNYNIIYGGIDSDTITQRIINPNGLMLAVQQRMATELSCVAVPLDFFQPVNQRVLFPNVETILSPIDITNTNAIKTNIAYLHNRLWGENVTTTNTEVEESYQLLLDLQRAGLTDMTTDTSWGNLHLEWNCAVHTDPVTGLDLSAENKVHKDELYIIRAWTGLINYMISDYQFLYE